jgi:mannitol-1-phosphate 5-dehydrogenase
MPLKFVGFGFGAIQAGLFVLEAFRSGNFGEFVVSEVDPALVAAVNSNGGRYHVNIAHADRIESVEVTGVRLLDPRDAADRPRLLDAIRHADELATALPGVRFYDGVGPEPDSAAALLAEAVDGTRPQLLYAAENDNHAAEKLRAAIAARGGNLAHLATLNTVIGKMSGIVTDRAEIARLGLREITPGLGRAFLVESFNQILIQRPDIPGLRHAIPAFTDKPDLLPFEEAKLFGHNAVHALLGYLGHYRGLTSMAQLAAEKDLLDFARHAFISESGTALIKKFAGLDPLFTPAGFASYANDLLGRMVNPFLDDSIARVIRDPARKLGWNDRLIGTLRLLRDQNVFPTHFPHAAAAALEYHLGHLPDTKTDVEAALAPLWGDNVKTERGIEVVWMVWDAIRMSR